MSVLCWDYNKYHTFIFLHRLYSDNSLFVTLIKCFSVGFFFPSNACWMNVMNVGRMKMKDDDRWWRMMTDGALGRRCNRGRTVAEDLLDGWTFKSFMFFTVFEQHLLLKKTQKSISRYQFIFGRRASSFATDSEIRNHLCDRTTHTHTPLRSPLFNTREECYLFLSIHNWKSNAEVPSQGWGDSSSLHTHTVEWAKTKDSGL